LEDVLDEMTPKRLVRYLAGAGWVYSRDAQDDASMVWRLFRGLEVRGHVTVPMHPDDLDYRARMRMALLGVLAAEGWPLATTMALIFPRELRASVV
jgi:predicted RNA binding protein YcfA (HicA-like mRNA interferase family)